jgi:hypothetical protein
VKLVSHKTLTDHASRAAKKNRHFLVLDMDTTYQAILLRPKTPPEKPQQRVTEVHQEGIKATHQRGISALSLELLPLINLYQ